VSQPKKRAGALRARYLVIESSVIFLSTLAHLRRPATNRCWTCNIDLCTRSVSP
jgi:hypothetical protein